MNVGLYRSSGYLVGKVDLEGNQASLVPIADLHVGTPTFFEKGFEELLRRIRDEELLWWSNGDLMEVGQKTSPGSSVYEQILTPQEQRKYLQDRLKPVSHLCLGLVKGNHEERIYKATGYDPAMLLAEALGVPYFGWEFFCSLMLGADSHRTSFTVYSCHTYSANKTAGLAFNWLEREVTRWVDNVDVVVKSHDHGKGAIPVEYVHFEGGIPAVKPRVRYLVLAGHFMHRPGSYLAGRGAGPKPPGSMLISLRLVKHEKVISCKEIPDEDWLAGTRAEPIVEKVPHLDNRDHPGLHGQD